MGGWRPRPRWYWMSWGRAGPRDQHHLRNCRIHREEPQTKSRAQMKLDWQTQRGTIQPTAKHAELKE